MINDILFQKNYDGVLLIFLEEGDAKKVLGDLHDGPIGRHYGGETTIHKVPRVRYYWLTLFKDAHAYAWKWKVC